MLLEKANSATIDISSSGANTIIVAPGAGRYLAIDHVNILPTTAVTVTFKSGTTALTGPYPLDTKQPITLENAVHHQYGIFKCADNEAFVITLGGAVQVGGYVQYRIVGN